MKKIFKIILVLSLMFLFSSSASAQLNLNQGGTGLSSYTLGDIIYKGSNNVRFAKLGIGANGTCLGVSSGLPAYITCGGGGAGTLAETSTLSTDATKSLYTMTSGVPVEFVDHLGASILKLDETTKRIGVNTNAPGASFEVNGNTIVGAVGQGRITIDNTAYNNNIQFTNSGANGFTYFKSSGGFTVFSSDTDIVSHFQVESTGTALYSGAFRSFNLTGNSNAPLLFYTTGAGSVDGGDILLYPGLLNTGAAINLANRRGDYSIVLSPSGTGTVQIPNGNVGIGTTSPGAKLEVNGNAIINSGALTTTSLTLGSSSAAAQSSTANLVPDLVTSPLKYDSTAGGNTINKWAFYNDPGNNAYGIGMSVTNGFGLFSGNQGFTFATGATNIDGTGASTRARILGSGNIFQINDGGTGASASELLSLKTSYTSNSAQKSLTWRDNANVVGQIATYYDGTKMNMSFGHLYNSGVQTSDLMTILGNGNVGIGTTAPGGRLAITEYVTAQPALSIIHGTNSDVISVTKSSGSGNLLTATFSSGQASGISFTNTDAATYLANSSMRGFVSTLSAGLDNYDITAGRFSASQTRNTLGTNGGTPYGIYSTAVTTANAPVGYAGYFLSGSARTTGLYIKGAASQSVDIFNVVNSSDTSLLKVDSTGNVGIGTTAPGEKLEVVGNIRNSALTASEIVASDANKNLVSLAVATYPSLTELTYVKGLTSSAQTQLTARLPLAGGTMSGAITLGENTSVALDPAGSADGKYSGTTVTGTGGATIAFGDLVTLDKDDSRWELVDISVAAAATGDARGIMGIAVTSSSDGAAITVLLNGIIRADANFPALTIGAAVYASTTGDVVVAQPSTTDYVIRIIGSALTADEIYFNPDAVWITHI